MLPKTLGRALSLLALSLTLSPSLYAVETPEAPPKREALSPRRVPGAPRQQEAALENNEPEFGPALPDPEHHSAVRAILRAGQGARIQALLGLGQNEGGIDGAPPLAEMVDPPQIVAAPPAELAPSRAGNSRKRKHGAK